jgi:trehalose utilization protein
MMRVTVWGENIHEHSDPVTGAVYPQGMHTVLAEAIREHMGAGTDVRTATLQEGEHGLDDDTLMATDVLTWWGHAAHDQVSDEVALRVRDRVLAGMGLVALHSAHYSKPFRLLMGTSCNLRWRVAPGERELIWNVNPGHPITQGLPEVVIIPEHEMYGEFFDIPPPDQLVFISSFSGGEVFRSGCCFHRGRGRVFYFSPGHETFPVYHQPEVRRVIANAVAWAAGSAAPRHVAAALGHSPTGWFESSTVEEQK